MPDDIDQVLGAFLPVGVPLPPGVSDLAHGLDLPWNDSHLPAIGAQLGASLFQWDRKRGEAMLARFAAASKTSADRVFTMSSDDFRQGLMTALFLAERRAAAAGLSVGIDTPLGPGYIVGAALPKAQANPNLPEARVYLEAVAAVQACLDGSRVAPSSATPDFGTTTTVAFPVAVALACVAIAAIAAAAYVGATYVQARADNLAKVALTSLDPKARAEALAELGGPSLPTIAGIGGAGMLLGALVLGGGLLLIGARR